MQNASDGVRRLGRPPKNQPSSSTTVNGGRKVTSAAHEVASSNKTFNHFLGTNQRSWMRPGLIAQTRPSDTNEPSSGQRQSYNDAHPPFANAVGTDVHDPDTSSTFAVPQASTVTVPVTSRPLPSYQFLSVPPEATSDHDSQTPNIAIARAEEEVQAEGAEESSLDHRDGGTRASERPLEPANNDNEVTRQPDSIVDKTSHAEFRTGHEVDVVDLTCSQDDEFVHRPGTHETHQPATSHAAGYFTTAELDALILATSAASQPPTANQPSVETALVPYTGQYEVGAVAPRNTEAPSSSAGHAASATTPTVPTAQACMATTSTVQEDPDAMMCHPRSTQLLTPAASPLSSSIDHLVRKRPGSSGSDGQHLPTRVRISSPQITTAGHTASSITVPVNTQQTSTTNHAPWYNVRSNALQRYQVPQRQHSTPLLGQPNHPSQDRSLSSSAPYNNFDHQQRQRPRLTVATPAPASGRGQSYLASFDTTIVEMSTRMDLSNRPELRIPWLRDACQNNDLFFLLLSQLLCTSYLNKGLVKELGFDASSESGFQVLELFFGHSKDFPEELLAYLAGWPYSTYSLKANPELSQRVTNIGLFLPRLGMLWDSFRLNCIRRKCPPTAREFADHFQCPPSIILPRAIFTSLERQIHPGASPQLEAATYDLFKANQREYFSLLRRVNGGRVDRIELSSADDFLSFSMRYLNIVATLWRPPNVLMAAPDGRATVNSTNNRLGHRPQSISLASHTPQSDSQTQQQLLRRHYSVTQANTSRPPAPNSAFNTAPARTRSLPLNHSTSPSNAVAAMVLARNTGPARVSTNQRGPIQNTCISTQEQNVVASPRNTTHAHLHNPQNLPVGGTQIFRAGVPPPANQALLPDLINPPPFLTNPVPEQEALHLSHLRQPLTKVEGLQEGQKARLYQAIESLAFGPYIFRPEDAFFVGWFDLSEEMVKRRSEIIEPPAESFSIQKRVLSTKSVLFNLRCVQLKNAEPVPGLSDWAALPTYYPQHIFIAINEQHLEIRRKRHFRKDLHVDVTPYVKEGNNEITVSLHPEKTDEGKHFGLAVEVIGLSDHTRAIAMTSRVSAEDSLRSITSSMQSAAEDGQDDDDMQVITDSIILSITDPFSSAMVTTPVRGKNCKHRECFDLNTYLESRLSDNKDALTSVYSWQCPTCGKDARPSNLVHDGFLQVVRDKLVDDGDSEARAIIVKEDGSWSVKPEVDREASRAASAAASKQNAKGEGKGDRASVASDQAALRPESRYPLEATSASGLPTTSRVIEIIDLDDD